MYVGLGVLIAFTYLFGKYQDRPSVYSSQREPDFGESKVIRTSDRSRVTAKERLLRKTTERIENENKLLREDLSSLKEEIEKLKTTKVENGSQKTPPSEFVTTPSREHSIRTFEESTGKTSQVHSTQKTTKSTSVGPSLINFPVPSTRLKEQKEKTIAIPSGSFALGMLMTSVAAPESKPYPALIQLDQAYVLPNKHKLDLSGCFALAKSQASMSLEVLEMQVTKISCVSKSGEIFEREINGYVVSKETNAFGIQGEVKSKRDRVASLGFLSAVVKGVGDAIKASQTSTTQTQGVGGTTTSTMITGDQAKYIAAGGASHAAGMITSWYLSQAEGLLPVIEVHSGTPIYIVLQEKVELPAFYFSKNVNATSVGQGVFSYFSNLLN